MFSVASTAFVTALTEATPPAVRFLSETLTSAGYRSWVVGGSVRDILLSELRGEPRQTYGDWDLATDARPEQVQRLFKKVIPTGIQHGTVTVVLRGEHFELTTLRGERGFSDGRRPDEVFFVDDLNADLARRDFTVNAIAFDVKQQTLHDPFEGLNDLKAGLLRAVGDPAQRFAEDGLRVLRGARFCATLGMTLETETRRALRPSLASFKKVSAERVRDEWLKALASKRPSACFEIQRSEGLLEVTAPELSSDDERWVATLVSLDAAARDPLRRLALLCTGALAGDAAQQASAAGNLASRLKLSNVERERLVRLVRHQSPCASLSPSDVRRWLASIGRAEAPDVLHFIRELPSPTRLDASDAFIELAERELASGHALALGELALSGRDLIASGAMQPGPRVGVVLANLLDKVLDDPALNEKSRLLSLATAADGV